MVAQFTEEFIVSIYRQNEGIAFVVQQTDQPNDLLRDFMALNKIANTQNRFTPLFVD
jgi:hypothetical protein